MTEFVTKRIARYILKEHGGNQYGANDSDIQDVATTDKNGKRTGKVANHKRPLPPGLTKQEQNALKKTMRRAHRLDEAFSICGIRIGWSVVIGIVPFLGDGFDALMALMVLRTILQVGIPNSLKSRMMLNIVIDFGIGLVPFLGDIADGLWRCNSMNADLLYKHLARRGEDRRRRGIRPEDDRRDYGKRAESPSLAVEGGANGGRRPTGRVLGEIDEQETGGVIAEQPPRYDERRQMPSDRGGRDGRGRQGQEVEMSQVQRPAAAKTKSSWRDRFLGSGAAPQQPAVDLENGDGMYEQRQPEMRAQDRTRAARDRRLP